LNEAWRLCRRPYADLSGGGARLAGGRWNRRGRAVVYLAEHPALAVLEVRVHLDVPLELLPTDYVLVRVQLPDEDPATPPDASDQLEAGDIWLRDAEAATMRVPSALVPFAYNLLLNPHHPRAAEASVVSLTPFRFDPRLWPDQRGG
jgi:RES domain-containing protein